MGFFDRWGGAIVVLLIVAGIWTASTSIDVEREMQRCRIEWLKVEASEMLFQRMSPGSGWGLEARKQEFQSLCMEAAGLERDLGVGERSIEGCWKGGAFNGLHKPECYRQPRWWDRFF